jgi:cell division protein FtsA
MEGRIITGLDIGTTKICAVTMKEYPDGKLNVVGIGSSPSYGLRKGVVVNIDKTVNSVKTAVQEAEAMAGIEIESVFVGIAGDHIRSINSKGMVGVSRDDHEISEEDVERAINAAKALALPMDREIIHVIPQEFIVDDQDGIADPVGMSGVRLEVEVHIVTAAVTSAQNIVRSVQRAGYEVEEIVLEPLASSLAVLDDDERTLGVCLVDIGGGTSDIAMFFDGHIHYTSVVALGGQHVTNDIAQGLRTPPDQAEIIKVKHGTAIRDNLSEHDIITVSGVGGRLDAHVRKNEKIRIAGFNGGGRSRYRWGCIVRGNRKTGGRYLGNAGQAGYSAAIGGINGFRTKPHLQHGGGIVSLRAEIPSRRNFISSHKRCVVG